MARAKLAAVLGIALAALPGAAHEKGADRAMGVVESIAADQIVVKTSDGHAVTFAITPETRFVRGGETARVEDVAAGERVVVQGKRAGKTLRAVQVKLAQPKTGAR